MVANIIFFILIIVVVYVVLSKTTLHRCKTCGGRNFVIDENSSNGDTIYYKCIKCETKTSKPKYLK